MKKLLTISITFFFILGLVAQSDTTYQLHFLEPAPTPIKKRKIALGASMSTLYVGGMTGLYTLWYRNTELSKFHFFNDAKEWQQVDKYGHTYTAYFETIWATKMFRWSGMSNKKSSIYGALVGFGAQSSIELFDGFSSKWGASWSDIGFNALGTGLALTQNLTWQEQRIRLKYSFHEVEHQDNQLLERSEDLYGKSPLERLIKDYNGTVTWISVNPTSFMKNPQRAEWLNIAMGFGSGGMYGGFANEWEDENGDLIVRNDVERYRKFLFSFDVDFERIQTEKHGLKTFLTLINIFKVPFPAMEFNTKGEVIFHPMFFLNWNKPILLKGKK
ncbi:MAG: DUF2279 domain-containing protein [Chitinophagales bacterium]